MFEGDFENNMIGTIETKKYLAFIFKMKDLGEANTILSIKIKKIVRVIL